MAAKVRGMLDGDSSSKAIGVRLRAARKAAGYEKAVDFAASIGYEPQRLAEWETGRKRLPIDAIIRVKSKIGASSDFLLFGDESSLPARFIGKLVDVAA